MLIRVIRGSNVFLMLLICQTNQSYDRQQLMTELILTPIFEEVEEGGFVGYVAELPGANTQGETLEEVRENLSEAIELILTSA